MRPIGTPTQQLGPFSRFALATATTWPMLAFYLLIDHHPLIEPTVVVMPSWVPFWPVFALPYSGMLFVWWLLPIGIRDTGRFLACLMALIVSYLLVMPWWIMAPTTLPRPALPDGCWVGFYRWLWLCDPPNNVMPCAHGIGPVVISWFLGRSRPKWILPLSGILVVGLPSIALTWQHRPIDIVIGTLAAVIGIIITELKSRRGQRRFNNLEADALPDSKSDCLP
jgi:hypothetical protein